MKKSILLYLFILALLFNVFTYAYFTKDQKFEKERYEKLDKKLHDSLNIVRNDLFDANYFSLETNQNAQDYFEDKKTGEFLDYQKINSFCKRSINVF